MSDDDLKPLADDEVPTMDGPVDEEVVAGDEPAGSDEAPAYDGTDTPDAA